MYPSNRASSSSVVSRLAVKAASAAQRTPSKRNTKLKVKQQQEEEEEEQVAINSHTSVSISSSRVTSTAECSMQSSLGDVLQSVCESYATHNKMYGVCTRLCETSASVFLSCLISHLAPVLTVLKSDKRVERVIEFVATTMAKFNDKHTNTMQLFIKRLLPWCAASDKAIRYRVCQMFCLLLRSLPQDDADLSEDVCESLVAALLARCQDKYSYVRACAGAALHRLQAGDEQDPIVKQYIHMMATDQAEACRVSAVDNIAIGCPSSIKAVLLRVRDCSPMVRAAAYSAIAKRVHLKQLSIAERAALIRQGLRDRDEQVVKQARALITDGWLKAKDNHVIRLLKSLDVETYSDECTLLISYIVSSGLHNNSNMQQPPYQSNKLTMEEALYWRVLVETKQSAGCDVDCYLPDTIELCGILSAHSGDPFICVQLLHLFVCGVDLQDEVGRREVALLVEKIIKNNQTQINIIAPALKVLRLVNPEENTYIRVVLELLSDIRDPLDVDEDEAAQLKRRELETKLETLQKKLEELKKIKQGYINTENYEKAQHIKTQFDDLLVEYHSVESELNSCGCDDAETWIRVLSICSDLLENTQKLKLDHAGLRGLFESCIQPGIKNDHPHVQLLSLKCLSLFCLLDRDAALLHMPMFLMAAQSSGDSLAIQAVAIRAMVDCCMVFQGLLEQTQQQQPTVNYQQVQTLLMSFLNQVLETDLDGDVREMCQCAIEGLCKLLLFDRLECNEHILSPLLFLFFQPNTDTALVQILAVFFQAYVAVDKRGSSSSVCHRSMLIRSFVPTVRLLVSAMENATKASSSEEEEGENAWKEFKVMEAIKCMCALTMQQDGANDELSAHESLALELCYQILAFPQASTVQYFLQTFSFLHLNPNSTYHVSSSFPRVSVLLSLLLLFDSLSVAVSSSVCSKYVAKINTRYQHMEIQQQHNKHQNNQSIKQLIQQQIEERVASIQHAYELEQDALREQQQQLLAPSVASSDSSVVVSSKSSSKRALRPKTPAKSRRRAAQPSSDEEEESQHTQSQARPPLASTNINSNHQQDILPTKDKPEKQRTKRQPVVETNQKSIKAKSSQPIDSGDEEENDDDDDESLSSNSDGDDADYRPNKENKAKKAVRAPTRTAASRAR